MAESGTPSKSNVVFDDASGTSESQPDEELFPGVKDVTAFSQVIFNSPLKCYKCIKWSRATHINYYGISPAYPFHIRDIHHDHIGIWHHLFYVMSISYPSDPTDDKTKSKSDW